MFLLRKLNSIFPESLDEKFAFLHRLVERRGGLFLLPEPLSGLGEAEKGVAAHVVPGRTGCGNPVMPTGQLAGFNGKRGAATMVEQQQSSAVGAVKVLITDKGHSRIGKKIDLPLPAFTATCACFEVVVLVHCPSEKKEDSAIFLL
ncbi:MAG: hypothetical protein ACOY32_15455 [Thermodesulfobacteriota bacterium]